MVSMVTVTYLVTSSFWGLKKINIFYCPKIIDRAIPHMKGLSEYFPISTMPSILSGNHGDQ